MLEQIGNAVTFYGQFTESKVGKTGLTVTVDVFEVVSDGSSDEIITGGSATEIGRGVYAYTLASGAVDAKAEYVCVFITATSSVDQQEVPTLWAVGKTWTERLDATISSVVTAVAAVAAAVWAYVSRTLTQTAASIVAAVSGDSITQTKGDSWDFDVELSKTVTGSKMQFMIKALKGDSDDDSIIFIDTTTGLIRVNKAAASSELLGSVTIGNGTLTDSLITIVLDTTVSAQLQGRSYSYGIQEVLADTTVLESWGGTFVVTQDVVKATE